MSRKLSHSQTTEIQSAICSEIYGLSGSVTFLRETSTVAWNTHDSQNWGTSDPLEPLVPKPHEFPLKNLGISDSLESVVPWNHLIPFADETTDSSAL